MIHKEAILSRRNALIADGALRHFQIYSRYQIIL